MGQKYYKTSALLFSVNFRFTILTIILKIHNLRCHLYISFIFYAIEFLNHIYRN